MSSVATKEKHLDIELSCMKSIGYPPTTTIVQKCLLSLPFFSIAINNLYFHALSRYNK